MLYKPEDSVLKDEAPFLTEEECDILEAFVKSSAFRIMSKIAEVEKRSSLSLLQSEKEMLAVYRIQGRIGGLNFLQAYPTVLEKQRAAVKARKAIQEKLKEGQEKINKARAARVRDLPPKKS